MPSPTKTTIEITDGINKENIITDYRWWTSDLDPFKTVGHTGLSFSGGVYKYIKMLGSHFAGVAEFYSDILDIYTGVTTTRMVLKLRGLESYALANPFAVGDSGSGRNLLAGGTIPVGSIRWKVTSVV